MKVRTSVKPICSDCKVIREGRNGIVRVVCKRIQNINKDKVK